MRETTRIDFRRVDGIRVMPNQRIVEKDLSLKEGRGKSLGKLLYCG